MPSCALFPPRRVSTGTLALVLCTRVGGQRPGLRKMREPGLPWKIVRFSVGLCASRPCKSPRRRLRNEGCWVFSLWAARKGGLRSAQVRGPGLSASLGSGRVSFRVSAAGPAAAATGRARLRRPYNVSGQGAAVAAVVPVPGRLHEARRAAAAAARLSVLRSVPGRAGEGP